MTQKIHWWAIDLDWVEDMNISLLWASDVTSVEFCNDCHQACLAQ